jgi:DNA (cytosine-5)-methyltransferase 1
VRALVAFCGEGGGSTGLERAGFKVFGVDKDPARLEHYPYDCHEGDAIEFILAHGHEFDFIATHPTCTGYSRGTAALPDRLQKYDRLIGVTREALKMTGRPWWIENVEGAKRELVDPVRLCGRQFGLKARDTDGTPLVMDRHRLFESPMPLMAPPHPPHTKDVQVAGAYGGARRDKWEAKHVRKGGYVPADLGVLRELLGTPWMTERGCFLSIPPVYAEFLGEQILYLMRRAAA